MLVPPSASTGPLKNMDASPPARKAHAHEIHEKAGSIQELSGCEVDVSREPIFFN
jgi:hypothetical protein